MLKSEKSCRCILFHDSFSSTHGKTLNVEPPVWWYQCICGRLWIRIVFEGYHTGSFTFYAAHVERETIDKFNINLIDDIFLSSDRSFVGGYDRGDRTEVYKGGFPVDPWCGFRREKRLLKAREFAIKAHGNQKYGDKPYLFHLQKVQEVMNRYHIATSDLFILIAGWLHDVLEDTATSKDEIVKNFGEEVADIVYLVSDEPGADREEKKHKTYCKIRGHIEATVVKLCAHIANVEASLNNPQRLRTYKEEHREFKRAIYVKRHTFLQDLWGDLNQLLD